MSAEDNKSQAEYPPYTIHIVLNREYEYLMRHGRALPDGTQEPVYVFIPVGEVQSPLHKRTIDYYVEVLREDPERRLFYIPDDLHDMAQRLTGKLKGRIIAVNFPDLPPSTEHVVA